jgi:hypothetical protein
MRRLLLAAAVLAMSTATGKAADPLQSGPQPGEALPGPFHTFNVTGDNAGERACLFCKHGDNPVVMIFAHDLTPALAALIKNIDAAIEKHAAAELGSFVVFCSDDATLKNRLENQAKKDALKHVVLCIDDKMGPKEYKLARDAEVTVIQYVKATVKANRAYRKGEFDANECAKVLADLPKIVVPSR